MEFLVRNDWLSWIYFIVSYSCVLSFFHSSLFVFKNPDKKSKKTKLLLKLPSLFLWNSLPLHFFFIEDSLSPRFLPLALILSVFSFVLYWCSVYSKKGVSFSVIHDQELPQKIYNKKIYAYIAHPFYSAYILCYLGIFLAMPNIVHFVSVSVITFIYWQAARQEQSNFLVGPLAAEYKKYRQQTGMFFPKFF